LVTADGTVDKHFLYKVNIPSSRYMLFRPQTEAAVSWLVRYYTSCAEILTTTNNLQFSMPTNNVSRLLMRVDLLKSMAYGLRIKVLSEQLISKCVLYCV